MSRSIHCAACALLLFSMTACAGRAEPARAPAPRAESTTAELEAIYRARMDSARTQFTEADAEFMTGMIGHHAQALVMARMAETHGARESVRILAARVINAQKDEIHTMQSWLRERGLPAPEVASAGMESMSHGPGHAMQSMPGMLTPEQMADLDAARGAEFDRLFLIYMIQHHSGALTMVDELFSSAGADAEPLTFKLASDMHADQSTEIARMKLMLAAVEDR